MSDARSDEAWYFDGRSAGRKNVSVVLRGGDLHIEIPEGATMLWPAGTFVVERFAADVRFVRQPYTGEAVLVADRVFVELLLKPERFQSLPMLIGLTATALVLLLALYLAAGPATNLMARMMRRQFDSAIGTLAVGAMAPESERLKAPVVEHAAQRVVRRLAQDSGNYRVVVSRSRDVNAFALPGGWVVLNCGLVRVMGSGDELAGVVAHEITHVKERHATRNLIRTMGARLVLSALVGGGDAAVDVAAMLGALRYMRDDEAAADEGALSILRTAGVNPAAMAKAFASLERHSVDLPSALRFLSTHPPIAERQARARGREETAVWVPVIPDSEWRAVLADCRCE